MEEFNCHINRIVFSSDQTGYCIVSASSPVHGNITLVGTLIGMKPQMDADVVGEWINHPRFGRQLKVTSWTETRPCSIAGIMGYLSSGLVKGIGPVLAERIVKRFGLETLNIIDADPEKLRQVDGIGKKKLEKIIENWTEQKTIRDIMVFLKEYQVSDAMAGRIYACYGKDSIQKITDNPYSLTEDVRGIGFLTADAIAMRMGIEPDSPLRIRSAIQHILETECQEKGHTYVDFGILVQTVTDTLTVKPELVLECLEKLIKDKKVIREDDDIYTPQLYRAECNVARKIQRMSLKTTLFNTEYAIPENGTEYNNEQKEAIKAAGNPTPLIITGGPGVGKTTTIKGIITALKTAGKSFELAAPTGRAAKRMSESTGEPAKTIHRLLEFGPEGFARYEDNPLDSDTIIVDEASMIDIQLMRALLAAIGPDTNVIFVGDIDQLPSVSPGNVLKDLIESGMIKTIRLTEIFRQASGSLIITNSHRINHGQMPVVSNLPTSDFFFSECEDIDKAAETIVELVTDRLPRKFNVSTDDIQILTPQHRGPLGTIELNRRIREKLLPKNVPSVLGYKVGDRVMQTKNDYKKDVFNGDTGYVRSIDEESDTIDIDFGKNELVQYQKKDIYDLEPAYAVTIHKSQGSEYPIVVMPIVRAHAHMLQRNLLYTGITRAKSKFIGIGTTEAIRLGVFNATQKHRNTRLKERLITEA